MGWLIGKAELDWARREITALREERALLLRDLNAARDRGDQAVNAWLEAKGERPLVTSPPPSASERDPFEEDPDRVEAIRNLIGERGLEAVLNGEQ